MTFHDIFVSTIRLLCSGGGGGGGGGVWKRWQQDDSCSVPEMHELHDS